MKTEAEKRNEFFDICHQNNVDYTASRYLWAMVRKLGLRGDDKPEGEVDGFTLQSVLLDGMKNVVSAELHRTDSDVYTALIKPKSGGPRPLTDLGPVFEAIQDSGVKSGDLGITRQRASTIVAAIQDAGIKFYSE